MKLSIDRQEKKGPFGGTYYESYIQLTLTEEEEKTARKIDFMSQAIFQWGRSEQDQRILTTLNNLNDRITLTIQDLTSGITAKINSDSELHLLGLTEIQIREKCKEFKAAIESYTLLKNAVRKGKSEEEI